MMPRILSLNTGLLKRLCGIFQPAPDVEARLEALPESLRTCGADIIALQEVYDGAHKEFLTQSLKALFPFTFSSPSRSTIRLTDGLFVLSNRAAKARFIPFEEGPDEERWLGRKGILVVETHFESALNILNVHATAGGLFSHPEAARADGFRTGQLRQLLRAADKEPSVPTLIVGDINAGPGVSEKNYLIFAEQGWVDLWETMHPHQVGWTWHPDNPLNVMGPHKRCPPQRIDHAFARRADIDAGRIQVRRCEIIFQDPSVRTSRGPMVTVSDHYGLVLDIELQPTCAAPEAFAR